MIKLLRHNSLIVTQLVCRNYGKLTNGRSDMMGSHLENLKTRYNELEKKLTFGDIDPSELVELGYEYSQLSSILKMDEERRKIVSIINDLDTVIQEESLKGSGGDEMVELAQAEREGSMEALDELDAKIVTLLIPKDTADERGAVLEVRAGTGGDEASLFASEIFRMYQKYSKLMGWKWEELSLSKSEAGGFKEAQASVTGNDVFKCLKFESGVHRVQRIPVNDTKIQTSAVSVIVMPEADEIDVILRPQDLKIDVFRASGAGGQSVNRTESAVRITHIPTGCSVSMQDERSQIQNRARAMKYLRARVYDLERRKMQESRSSLRAAAQGTGDRSDKIRTYNFPQDRVTDHRVSGTVTGVERVLSGEMLSSLVDGLVKQEYIDKLNTFWKEMSNKS